MIKELIEYTEANFGKVDNVALEDDHTLVVSMESVLVNTSMLEKMIDHNPFLEGLSHDYENVAIFDICPDDEMEIAREILSI